VSYVSPLRPAHAEITYSKRSVPLPNTPIPHSRLSTSHSHFSIPAPRLTTYRPGSRGWNAKIEASLGLLGVFPKGMRQGVDFEFGVDEYGIGDVLLGLGEMYVLIRMIVPDISAVL
jgi:hypothetical protein